MSLSKKELAVALSLLISKDPIVDLSIFEDSESFSITHLSGKTSSYDIPVKTITEEVTEKQEIDYDEIRSMVEQYSKDHAPNNYDDSGVYEHINNQIRYLEDQIVSIEPKTEIIENETVVKENFDDRALKEWVINLVENVRKTIPSIEDITPQIIEKTIEADIDYNSIFSEIDRKINDIRPEASEFKYVVDIIGENNDVFLKFNDGKYKRITELVQPSVVRHFASGGGGGGGSPGRDGESAYDIAVRNGFDGSEQEWLESLSGDYTAPEDGTVNYDSEGNVESLLIGDSLTEFERDSNGNIFRVYKPTHIQEFIRDTEGRITGWVIV